MGFAPRLSLWLLASFLYCGNATASLPGRL
jgi:hypothetical protein